MKNRKHIVCGRWYAVFLGRRRLGHGTDAVPDFEDAAIDAQEIESLAALAASGTEAQEPAFEFSADNRPVQRFASMAEY